MAGSPYLRTRQASIYCASERRNQGSCRRRWSNPPLESNDQEAERSKSGDWKKKAGKRYKARLLMGTCL